MEDKKHAHTRYDMLQNTPSRQIKDAQLTGDPKGPAPSVSNAAAPDVAGDHDNPLSQSANIGPSVSSSSTIPTVGSMVDLLHTAHVPPVFTSPAVNSRPDVSLQESSHLETPSSFPHLHFNAPDVASGADTSNALDLAIALPSSSSADTAHMFSPVLTKNSGPRDILLLKTSSSEAAARLVPNIATPAGSPPGDTHAGSLPHTGSRDKVNLQTFGSGGSDIIDPFAAANASHPGGSYDDLSPYFQQQGSTDELYDDRSQGQTTSGDMQYNPVQPSMYHEQYNDGYDPTSASHLQYGDDDMADENVGYQQYAPLRIDAQDVVADGMMNLEYPHMGMYDPGGQSQQYPEDLQYMPEYDAPPGDEGSNEQPGIMNQYMEDASGVDEEGHLGMLRDEGGDPSGLGNVYVNAVNTVVSASRETKEGLDENNALEMTEVIHWSMMSSDPLEYLKEAGLRHLGQVYVTDKQKAFLLRGKSITSYRFSDPRMAAAGGPVQHVQAVMLDTEGHEHLNQFDWCSMWTDKVEHITGVAVNDISAKGGSCQELTQAIDAYAVSIRDAAAIGAKGMLRPLLLRFRAGAAPQAMFSIPAVQVVVAYKWSRFARYILSIEMALYSVWLVCHCAFSLILMDEDPGLSLSQLMSSTSGAASLAASVAASTAMIPILYGEACVLREYGQRWISIGNCFDMTSYGLQVTVMILHMLRWPVATYWFSILVSIQHVLLWGKLQYYARVFESTRNFRIVDTVRLVLMETHWLLTLMALIMIGFGFSFYTLYKQDRAEGITMYYQDHTSLSHSLLSTFMYLLAMFDMSVFYDASHPVAATILFLVYSTLTAIILINILMAAFISSYNKVREGEELRLLQYQAQVIDEVETMIPRWLLNPAWFPSFVHCISLTPDTDKSSFEVDTQGLMTGTQKAEAALHTSHKETMERLLGLEMAADSLMTMAESTLHCVSRLVEDIMQQQQQAATTAAGKPSTRPSPTPPSGVSRRPSGMRARSPSPAHVSALQEQGQQEPELGGFRPHLEAPEEGVAGGGQDHGYAETAGEVGGRGMGVAEGPTPGRGAGTQPQPADVSPLRPGGGVARHMSMKPSARLLARTLTGAYPPAYFPRGAATMTTLPYVAAVPAAPGARRAQGSQAVLQPLLINPLRAPPQTGRLPSVTWQATRVTAPRGLRAPKSLTVPTLSPAPSGSFKKAATPAGVTGAGPIADEQQQAAPSVRQATGSRVLGATQSMPPRSVTGLPRMPARVTVPAVAGRLPYQHALTTAAAAAIPYGAAFAQRLPRGLTGVGAQSVPVQHAGYMRATASGMAPAQRQGTSGGGATASQRLRPMRPVQAAFIPVVHAMPAHVVGGRMQLVPFRAVPTQAGTGHLTKKHATRAPQQQQPHVADRRAGGGGGPSGLARGRRDQWMLLGGRTPQQQHHILNHYETADESEWTSVADGAEHEDYHTGYSSGLEPDQWQDLPHSPLSQLPPPEDYLASGQQHGRSSGGGAGAGHPFQLDSTSTGVDDFRESPLWQQDQKQDNSLETRHDEAPMSPLDDGSGGGGYIPTLQTILEGSPVISATGSQHAQQRADQEQRQRQEGPPVEVPPVQVMSPYNSGRIPRSSILHTASVPVPPDRSDLQWIASSVTGQEHGSQAGPDKGADGTTRSASVPILGSTKHDADADVRARDRQTGLVALGPTVSGSRSLPRSGSSAAPCVNMNMSPLRRSIDTARKIRSYAGQGSPAHAVSQFRLSPTSSLERLEPGQQPQFLQHPLHMNAALASSHTGSFFGSPSLKPQHPQQLWHSASTGHRFSNGEVQQTDRARKAHEAAEQLLHAGPPALRSSARHWQQEQHVDQRPPYNTQEQEQEEDQEDSCMDPAAAFMSQPEGFSTPGQASSTGRAAQRQQQAPVSATNRAGRLALQQQQQQPGIYHSPSMRRAIAAGQAFAAAGRAAAGAGAGAGASSFRGSRVVTVPVTVPVAAIQVPFSGRLYAGGGGAASTAAGISRWSTAVAGADAVSRIRARALAQRRKRAAAQAAASTTIDMEGVQAQSQDGVGLPCESGGESRDMSSRNASVSRRVSNVSFGEASRGDASGAESPRRSGAVDSGGRSAATGAAENDGLRRSGRYAAQSGEQRNLSTRSAPVWTSTAQHTKEGQDDAGAARGRLSVRPSTSLHAVEDSLTPSVVMQQTPTHDADVLHEGQQGSDQDDNDEGANHATPIDMLTDDWMWWGVGGLRQPLLSCRSSQVGTASPPDVSD